MEPKPKLPSNFGPGSTENRSAPTGSGSSTLEFKELDWLHPLQQPLKLTKIKHGPDVKLRSPRVHEGPLFQSKIPVLTIEESLPRQYTSVLYRY